MKEEYTRPMPKNAAARRRASVVVRLRRAIQVRRPVRFFNPEWYLQYYRDVAAAGTDPWLHFHLHGIHEGRFANPEHVDILLCPWAFERAADEFWTKWGRWTETERGYLSCLLARRYAMEGRWEALRRLFSLEPFEKYSPRKIRYRRQAAVLYAESLRHTRRRAESSLLIAHLSAALPNDPGIRLLAANHALTFESCVAGTVAGWLAAVNSLYRDFGLETIALSVGEAPRLDRLRAADSSAANIPAHLDRPMVSVIMPARNAADTIESAVTGLLAQTWQNIELIIIDDASTDETARIVEERKAKDRRVTLLRQPRPYGAYAARNRGLDAASGHYITVHDADDWSHPQKIEEQMSELREDSGLKGSMSCGVRITPQLEFSGWDHPSSCCSWVHENASSFLYKREVFESLGYWDEVKCGGDAEYVDRVKAAWGSAAVSVVRPGIPLAFGRISSGSLTASHDTHILTSLKGARADYQKAYRNWHRSARSLAELYRVRGDEARPFTVPPAVRFDLGR